MKFNNIYPDNIFKLTQSSHGKYQNYKAIDTIKANEAIVPFGDNHEVLTFSVGKRGGVGSQSWFNLVNSTGKYYLQIVHGTPYKNQVKSGDPLGRCTIKNNHFHIAIYVLGTWDILLNYIKQTNQIVLIGKPWNPKWGRWSTYPDKTLPTIPNTTDFKLTKVGKNISLTFTKLAKPFTGFAIVTRKKTRGTPYKEGSQFNVYFKDRKIGSSGFVVTNAARIVYQVRINNTIHTFYNTK